MQPIKTFRLRQLLLKAFILSIPFNNLGSPIPLLSLSLFILLLYFIISAPNLIKRTTFNIIQKPLTYLIILYFLILATSLINFIPDTRYSMTSLRHIPMYIVVTYIFSDAIIKGLLSLKTILIYYIAGFALMTALFFVGFNVSNIVGRQSLMGINPNRIATLSNIAILSIVNLLHKYSISNIKRYLLYAMLPAFIYLSIATASRGGFIGLMLALSVYYYFKKQGISGKLKNSFKVFFIAGILTLVFLSNDVFYQRIFETEKGMTEDRTRIWEIAYRLVSDDIVFGIGVFRYERDIMTILHKYKSTHNEYLSILITSGILGLSIFLLFLYEAYKSSLASIKNSQNPLFMSLLALILFTFFKAGGSFIAIYTWFIFPLILTSNVVLNNLHCHNVKKVD